MHGLVSSTGYSGNTLGFPRLENFIHHYLVVVHRTANPQFVIIRVYTLFLREWIQYCDASHLFYRAAKVVSHKYTTLWCSKVGTAHLQILVVVGLVHNTDSRTAPNTDSNK